MKRPTAYHSRRSIPFFSSLSSSQGPAVNVHMFTEDVHLGVMPIGGRSYKHPQFSARFEGKETDNKNAVHLCTSLTQYDRHDHCTSICDAVNEIAQHLSWRGWTVYEIIREASEPQKISLLYFPTDCLYKILGYYIQWVPSADQKLTKKRFVFLPSNDVWEISIPRVLGGARGYRKILEDLKLSHKLIPDFYLTDMQNQRQTPGFSPMNYVRSREIHEVRATRRWGWNRRDSSLEHQTEFFYFYRTITFKWAQAVLREHIVNELNCLLSRVTINSKIVIDGLPMPDVILKIRQDLVEGKIQFSEADNQSSVY